MLPKNNWQPSAVCNPKDVKDDLYTSHVISMPDPFRRG